VPMTFVTKDRIGQGSVDSKGYWGTCASASSRKQPVTRCELPVVIFGRARLAGVYYVRYSSGILTLLLPSAVLTFFASSFWALASFESLWGV